MKTEKVESHEEAIVRHLKAVRIAQLKSTVEQEANTIRKVKKGGGHISRVVLGAAWERKLNRPEKDYQSLTTQLLSGDMCYRPVSPGTVVVIICFCGS